MFSIVIKECKHPAWPFLANELKLAASMACVIAHFNDFWVVAHGESGDKPESKIDAARWSIIMVPVESS